VVGVVLDVSERKRLEEQLRQAQRMEAVGRLAGGVAHDFNNLLTAILSFGSFALDALHRQDPAYEDVSEMLNAAKRAEALTAQLLAFSRQKPVSPRVINVNDVVTELERMLRRLLGEDIEVATALASELGTVRIDPNALEQVVVNLAINARDAMPGGGRLTIETAHAELEENVGAPKDVAVPTGSYVMLAVSDTGTGIDEATQARIFEPFFSTKRPGHGTGLGLATCYGIVKQAGGHIWLYSEPGKGTTFKVYLPRISDKPEVARKPKSVETLGGSERVLIVEDDEQVRRLAARALSRLGYRVSTATSGGEAINLCEGLEPIDLLLTDVVMPEMSGMQLIECVAALQPKMVSLFMSGYAASAVAERGVPDPERRLIQKPFTPEGLARAVRRALDERGA
jgi:nitrogen-specific signal transduction histidine kinase/ActR/RegA family two-component response regulator